MVLDDGDREIGGYKDGKEVGVFVRLCKNGKVIKINY